MSVYRLELVVWRFFNGTVVTCPVFPRKQATINLAVLLGRVTFVGFFFVLEDPYNRLLLYFGVICIDPWFITFVDIIYDIWRTAIVFFQHFFAPSDANSFFWAIVKFLGIQREQIFYVQVFMQNGTYASHAKAPGCPNLALCPMTAITRFFTASMFSGSTTDFGPPSLNFSLSELRPRLNSLSLFLQWVKMELQLRKFNGVEPNILVLIIRVENRNKSSHKNVLLLIPFFCWDTIFK